MRSSQRYAGHDNLPYRPFSKSGMNCRSEKLFVFFLLLVLFFLLFISFLGFFLLAFLRRALFFLVYLFLVFFLFIFLLFTFFFFFFFLPFLSPEKYCRPVMQLSGSQPKSTIVCPAMAYSFISTAIRLHVESSLSSAGKNVHNLSRQLKRAVIAWELYGLTDQFP